MGHIRNQTQESVPLSQRGFYREASNLSHRQPSQDKQGHKGAALFTLMDKIMLLDKLELEEKEAKKENKE